MWRSQAEAEGLTLLVADNKTGYFGVTITYPNTTKPYQARVRRGGKRVTLGYFATAEEAALCVARSPEGQAAAKRAAAPPPLTSEEARQQARADGLTLRVADTNSGYYGVNVDQRAKTKPYQAQVKRGGKHVHLGTFATADEAALCIARSPEGQEAATQAAAPPPLTNEEAEDVVVVEAVVVEAVEAKEAEEEAEDVQMEAVEVVEVVEVMGHEAVVGEGGRSEGRPKRRRNM